MGVDYNTKRKAVWGSGQIEALVRKKMHSRVTALMVNVDMLTPFQQVNVMRRSTFLHKKNVIPAPVVQHLPRSHL